MTTTFDVTGARAVVVGGGRSGQAAARLLAARGARATLTDVATRLDGLEDLESRGVRVELGSHREDLLTAADLVVLSPGVSPDLAPVQAARRRGVAIIGELELASRWVAGRIIAITGTKGKSTTTTLVELMLRDSGVPAIAGGNLGTPLSAQVAESTPDLIHVVEVSSFQLETTDTFHPWIAVLLNLSPDHLDRHRSLDEYAAAKARIFRNQTAGDWAVLNADEPELERLVEGVPARRFDFSMSAMPEDGVAVRDELVVSRRTGIEHPLWPVTAVRLKGRHLLADVLAAAAASLLAGGHPAGMRRAVEGFGGLEHTLEVVASVGGVQFINDSKATNVAAAGRALESLGPDVVPILGGRYKGGAFEDLRPMVRDRARGVIAIGEAADRISAALADVVPVERAGSMEEAVVQAYRRARPSGVVVLAPGCSSFDMFDDYAARGRAFKAAVARLAAAESSAGDATTLM